MLLLLLWVLSGTCAADDGRLLVDARRSPRLAFVSVSVCVMGGRGGSIKRLAWRCLCYVYVCLCGCGTKRSTTTETTWPSHGTTKNTKINHTRRAGGRSQLQEGGPAQYQIRMHGSGDVRVCADALAGQSSWKQQRKPGRGKMLLLLVHTHSLCCIPPPARRSWREQAKAHTTRRRPRPSNQRTHFDPNDRFKCSSRGANNATPSILILIFHLPPQQQGPAPSSDEREVKPAHDTIADRLAGCCCA